MDERMVHLFSIIAGRVQNKQELFEAEAELMQTLLNHGCRLYEADAAITLMQRLVQKKTDTYFASTPTGLRAMNREERGRFTIEAFGFVLKLTHLGIIGEHERDELLEWAMTVYPELIELDDIKSLIAYTLFGSPQDRIIADPIAIRRIKETAWN
jgi:uncharacterized protein Smg (DUF494 family)